MTDQNTTPVTISSFDQDAFNLQPFAKRLEDFLLVERKFVEGALVVSVGAPFGAGKSTFLKMWKADLEKRRTSDATLPHPLTLNAWESDFCGDPFVAVIAELVQVVETVRGKNSTSSHSFREAAKQVAWFGAGLANSFIASVSGVDAVAAGELAADKSSGKPDILKNYEERLESLVRIRDELGKHFGEGTPGALIMVDELDRCRPEYAIGYLETVKHVFGVKGLIFVLAVDSERLAASAQTVFGSLNFDEFYRKFVHRSVALPSADEAGTTELVRRYITHFVEREGIRISFAKIEHHHIERVVELVRVLKMTPRQTQEVLRIAGHVLTGSEEKRGRLLWCLTNASLLLAIIRVADAKLFVRLKENSVSAEQFGKFLTTHLKPGSAHWWFTLYLTGSEIRFSDDEVEALYKSLGFDDIPRRGGGDFSQFFQGWGQRSGRIAQIVSMIDGLDFFR